MRPIGIGLYPLAALINHSCTPNGTLLKEVLGERVRKVPPESWRCYSIKERGDMREKRVRGEVNIYPIVML